MALSAEPIFDIVRGISSVTAFTIIVRQCVDVWHQLFEMDCECCRGTGRLTCRHCHGTKNLRLKAAHLSIAAAALQDPTDQDVNYPCVFCGPESKHDYVPADEIEDDPMSPENEAIYYNLLAAKVGKRPPKKMQPAILAGMVACDDCGGSGLVKRHTPNINQLIFGGDQPVYFKLAQRLGNRYMGAQNRPRERPRPLLEYPTYTGPRPAEPRLDPVIEELTKLYWRRQLKDPNLDDGRRQMLDQRLLPFQENPQFVFSYVDEDDTDDDEW